jgi:salicylate hydroxylase
MTADESVISDDSYAYNLEPMGIRRWKLQKLLYEAVLKRGMIVEFGKKIKRATAVAEDNSHSTIKTIALEFFGNPNDTTVVHTELLLAADGAKSAIRESLHLKSKLTLTGTTCMYGVADLPYDIPPGLSLPSSETTKCHGAFYATDKREQCFQFHMPTKTHQQLQQQPANSCNDGDDDEASSASSIMHAVWDPLSSELCREECQGLAEVLADEGWNETKYLRALRHAHKAIKVPFALLEPPLETFLYTDQKRIVLVGDAAHPPVPYLGQGAQQGLEDAGTLALCLKGLCVVSSDHGGKKPFFDGAALDTALKLYDKMRVPRTRDILEKSKNHGLMQQKRAEAKTRTQARARENLLQRDVFFHETLQDVLPGATYDYKEAVVLALKEEPLGIILEDGFSDDDENEAKSQGHDQVRQGEIGDTLS